MQAQDQESKKNYIGLLNGGVDEDAPAKDTLVRSDRRMKSYLFGWMAAVLNRQSEAR